MRTKRKEELLHEFPSISYDIAEQMKGRGASNFAVMLTWGKELFVRCYHRYSNGKLAERQRYVFADDGAVRYGSDDSKHWSIRKNFREPVFCKSGYGYSFDNTYTILNRRALASSCMKYSQLEHYTGNLIMEYLHLYCKHRNLEYLMKSGYSSLLGETYSGFWGSQKHICMDYRINWESNNLLKMLRLNRIEFKALQGNEKYYPEYISWREIFPKCKPDELILMSKVFGDEHETAKRFCELTGLKPQKIASYLSKYGIKCYDYQDYLEQCRQLRYNLHDTAISLPHYFFEMHERLTIAIKYEADEACKRLFAEHMQKRKELEFQSGNLLVCQPDSMDKIIAEGKVLHHCVAGYAERHALGKLHILFIRQADKLDIPFYTMEVATDGNIKQVRGLHNSDPTPEVADLVEQYKIYLGTVFRKKLLACMLTHVNNDNRC
ncbi:MAG: PcfJ domain-containing protein [Oscillospiraceae bacterium]|nr:PcfJ domain-containing protein [Oscillospiraceae bacterium]